MVHRAAPWEVVILREGGVSSTPRPLEFKQGRHEVLDHPPSRVMTSVEGGGTRSIVSKLNRSRKFLRDSTMLFTNARSVSLVIIGSIRSSWFIATSCRISVRSFPA